MCPPPMTQGLCNVYLTPMPLPRRARMVIPLLLTTVGCLPMLAHDTRVTPGPALALHTGLQFGERQRPVIYNSARVMPALGLQLAHGVRSDDSAGVGGRIAAGVASLGGTVNADAYLQFASSTTAPVDAGIGIAAQWGTFDAVLPYLQFGQSDARGSAWFTSQHVGWFRTGDVLRWNLVWMPTLALTRRSTRSLHFFATGVVGSRGADCARRSCPGKGSRSERTFLLLGVATEIPLTRTAPRRSSR